MNNHVLDKLGKWLDTLVSVAHCRCPTELTKEDCMEVAIPDASLNMHSTSFSTLISMIFSLLSRLEKERRDREEGASHHMGNRTLQDN